MGKKYVVLIIVILVVIASGLSVYLLLRKNTSPPGIAPDGSLVDTYEKNFSGGETVVGMTVYGAEGFDSPEMQLADSEPVAVMVENASGSPLTLRFMTIPPEYQYQMVFSTIEAGAVGIIELPVPGMYTIVNTQDDTRALKVNYVLSGGVAE